ncbi:MAG TPA: phosphoglycerate kinase [Candidatus Nanoarchaeia archaeon]|nr:phosphoglycerate kinase [Candidatus Nanoarchaeia archaeon]
MRSIKEVNVSGKRVLVRCGFDIPVDDQGFILDDKRIVESLPTIKYLLEKKAKIILCGHNGRPKGKLIPRLSMDTVAKRLSSLLQRSVLKLNDCVGSQVESKVRQMAPGDILLLENLRFHAEEQNNDSSFAKQLASLADLFVQDAYNNAHHSDVSMVLLPKFLPSYVGLSLEKELKYMQHLTQNPLRPYIAIIGGAKAEKLPVIKNLLDKVDKIIIGGVIANTFLKAKGIDIAKSKFDEETLSLAKKFIEHEKIVLPVDVRVGDKWDVSTEAQVADLSTIPKGFMIMDIGPQTVLEYTTLLQSTKTVVWCGPIGAFELPAFSTGTKALAECLANLKATTIIGGGDSADAVDQLGLASKMTHVSVGGGATLAILAGKELPAIKALEENEKLFG